MLLVASDDGAVVLKQGIHRPVGDGNLSVFQDHDTNVLDRHGLRHFLLRLGVIQFNNQLRIAHGKIGGIAEKKGTFNHLTLIPRCFVWVSNY